YTCVTSCRYTFPMSSKNFLRTSPVALFILALAAQSAFSRSKDKSAAGQTTVQVEMHTSTVPVNNPESAIKSSSSTASAASTTTARGQSANTPDPAQVDKINQAMKALRSPVSESWPRAALTIHTASPNLVVPGSILT